MAGMEKQLPLTADGRVPSVTVKVLLVAGRLFACGVESCREVNCC
jgi:hypothetical protein